MKARLHTRLNATLSRAGQLAVPGQGRAAVAAPAAAMVATA